MYLGIEIGGTKLQLGVGAGDGSELVALERLDVDPRRGALGILEAIEQTGARLLARHAVERIGIGFGGPVASATGVVVKSHQIAGWDGLPLGEWCRRTLGKPTQVGNDCDVAALAEARFGAGRGSRIVFYVTVGTGVGGGMVVDGRSFGAFRPAVAEIGHLRPGLIAEHPEQTVEALASGWGLAAAAVARLTGQVSRPLHELRPRVPDSREEFQADLLARCGNRPEQLTARMLAQAAEEGNEWAAAILAQGTQALGWAVAQVITLVAPETIVVGGGVSLAGETLFFEPLRAATARYVFPPLAGSYRIVPAALGERVVVHGALALAAE